MICRCTPQAISIICARAAASSRRGVARAWAASRPSSGSLDAGAAASTTRGRYVAPVACRAGAAPSSAPQGGSKKDNVREKPRFSGNKKG